MLLYVICSLLAVWCDMGVSLISSQDIHGICVYIRSDLIGTKSLESDPDKTATKLGDRLCPLCRQSIRSHPVKHCVKSMNDIIAPHGREEPKHSRTEKTWGDTVCECGVAAKHHPATRGT